MAKVKGKLKRVISIILTLTMIASFLQIPAYASNAVYLPQDVISEEILSSGGFYLATPVAQIEENSGASHLLKIGRGGEFLPKADVKLDMIDITARYGDDYTIKVYNSSIFGEKVKNSLSSGSIIDEIIENEDEIVEENYTDLLVEGAEADLEEGETLEEVALEEFEEIDEFLSEEFEGYEEAKNAYFETEEPTEDDIDVQTEEEPKETSEDAQTEAKPSEKSLKRAKEIATGLKSDKTPMDGGNATIGNYVNNMIEDMAAELESAYLVLEFNEGETERYIEIIPKDNDTGEGNRMFSINLVAGSENATVSDKAGMTVTIVDDEDYELATVSFAETSYSPENGYIKVVMERTGALSQVVCVDVKTEDITAEKTRDYSQVATSVVFPYGIKKRTLNIPVCSDYIEESAEFKIVMSNPTSCNIGEIGTAKGVIYNDSESFKLFSEDEEEAQGDASRSDATASSRITGEALDIKNTYSAWVTSNAKSDSYVRATDDGLEIYTKASSGGAASEISWNAGGRYDISGFAIDWTKESGKPCYTETYVYGDAGGWDEKLWDSSTERWEKRVTDIYFPYDIVGDYFIRQTRNKGFWGTSPTLKIHSIKPILRPFEISLKGAEPVKFLNENGEYVDNTTMSEVADANNTLLRNATNTGTGTVVKFSGDSFTVTSNSRFSYIKGLKIVNEETGKSKVIKDNLAVGTTSVSIALENDFLRDNVDYICYYDNGSMGRKGSFSVQPIMGKYETDVKIYKDYRGEVTYNGTPALKEESDGVRLTYNKGDQIRFTQVINPEYSSSYTGSRIRIVTKDSSTSKKEDKLYLYEEGTNYHTINNGYAEIEIYPNFDKKDNHIVVKVAKDDLEKFNKDMGIFTMPCEETDDYMEYTVVDSSVFATGTYYDFAARTNDADYTPVWQKIHSDVKYSQPTFYFESKSEIEENIIYLTCEKADEGSYALTGDAYYSNVTVNGNKEGVAWMPASGVYVMMGADKYGISDEKGTFNTVGMSGINGYDVIYKTVASGKTEYKTATLSNAKTKKIGFGEEEVEVYDVNIGTIKASASDITSPYINSIRVENNQRIDDGYVHINNSPFTFTAVIANNGAKYTDTDGVERTENVKAVDFLIYDVNTHQLKYEINGAIEVANANGISMWTATASFQMGENAKYSASDEVYVRITTDKVIGNGKGYNADGEFTEVETLCETLHAPVNTGYTFVESNRTEPVYHDIDYDVSMDFIELPFIGNMEGSYNVKKFGLSLSNLPNGGVRLSLGYVVKSEDELKKEASPDYKGDYKEESIKKAAQDIMGFGKKLSGDNKHYTGVSSWAVYPTFGIYLDFGIKNFYYTDKITQKIVFIGGGFYIGFTTKFRVVGYTVIYGIPVYLGTDGAATCLIEGGFQVINEDTVTSDHIMTKQNSLQEGLSPSFIVRANTNVSLYAGVGLCGTLGVRGGAMVSLSYIENPTILLQYPDYNPLGLLISANIKFWIDLFYFPVPIPAYEITTKRFGYYADVYNSDKAELMSAESSEEAEISVKPRNSKNAEWMPEGDNVSLFATFAPETSTVLLENGYDRADSQLLDLGDGRIMLAFVADDPTRTDEERTALMYSIYDNGAWSSPVKVQDDGTADFEPDICDAGDKVLITWTSKEPGEYSSETEFIKSLEVYTTTLDKNTLELGEIEKLTEDEFYDSAPKGIYDEVSGDYMVYYLKADVSEDFLKSVSPTTNESVIVYMLYDAKEGKWARDYYYDNEVESEEAEDFLVTYWGGQRFLSSPIEDFEMYDPIIIDFDSISYNGLGVYTYTVDEDNNIDTPNDRELFVQVYDFEGHATYVPIRITNDNITDARPQLVRSGEYTYLFWLQNDKDIRYINISELIKEGVNDDGTIKEDYELGCGMVFFSPSGEEEVSPTFGSYNAFVDKDENLYVTWLQPVVNEDGTSNQEVYASALIRNSSENTSWSEGVRLTNSGVFNDEVAFVTDSNGDLLTVGNQYAMNLSSDENFVEDVKLVATKFKTVGSMEVDEVTYSNDAPQANSKTTVTAKVKNTGLKPAKGYTIKVYEKVNGEVGNEVYSFVSEKEVTPSSSSYVTFDWTMPESLDGIDELALYMEVQEAETSETQSFTSESIKIQPVYKIVDYSVDEREDGFYASYTVENIGNVDALADSGDKVVINFNDAYHDYVEVSPYLQAPIGELKINEFKTMVMPLSIEDKQLELGYSNAYIEVQNKDGEAVSEYNTFIIATDKPYNIIINGDENLTEIKLKEGESTELSAESYKYTDIKFNITDESVAYIKDGKLVGKNAGETELVIESPTYGTYKTIKVVVANKSGSSGGSSSVTRYTITLNTNGGSKINSVKRNKNALIGEIEKPVKEGYVFEGWYLDKELTKKADLNAKVTSDITLYAKWEKEATQAEWKNPFKDVKSNDWFYESVKYANQNGLFGGTDKDTFSPNEDLTRAMLVTVLYRAEGEPKNDAKLKFKDVLDGAYYEDAVIWAQDSGIITGVSDDEFAPDAKITREQIATIMYRYAVYKGANAVTMEENLGFKDSGDISEYAVSAMNWIVGKEIINGYEDNTVKPKNNATRAEATAVLQRFIEKINQINNN